MPPRPQKKPNKLKVVIPAVAAVVVAAVVAFFVVSGGMGNAGGTVDGGSGTFGAVQAGDTVTFGTYEQDNDTSNGKEAIEWQVLDVQDGKALLISKYALDCQQYNTTKTDVTWETCSLRSWLNSDFYTAAFSSSEQSKVASTTLTNKDSSKYGTKGGNATTDKVFCLSLSEADKYFSSDSARLCSPTTYAEARGADRVSDSTLWWLRSPGNFQSSAARVLYDGYVQESGWNVDSDCSGVRPALWVNL